MNQAQIPPPGTAAIVSVGDEVLSGRVVDTNAALVARELEAQGWRVVHRSTVGDDIEAIVAHLRVAASQARVVIVGGGLGPTADDVTREGIARFAGVELAEDPEALAVVERALVRSSRGLSAENRRQALLPRGARPIDNPIGTAPGIHWAGPASQILALPGVPRELKVMLEPSLKGIQTQGLGLTATVRDSVIVVGLPESEIGRRLADLMARGAEVSVGSYPTEGVVRIVAECRRTDESRARQLVMEVLGQVRERLGGAVVRRSAPDLATAVFRELLARGATLAVAESITGGSICNALVGVPGISSVFEGGVVAYANAQKQSWLGVQEALLRSHGAVSAEVAAAMAEGVRRGASTTFGLSTTGVAGPTGGTPQKPVGLVYFALAGPRGTTVEQRIIPGDRELVRERAVAAALDLLRRELET